MQSFLDLVLHSGETAINLALFILLPVMVVMLGLMKLLEAYGVLTLVARILTPALGWIGIPALGVFAALQILFVGFAAPAATLAIMAKRGIGARHIAATLAMVLALAQANAVFPLATAGLHVGLAFLIAVIGGGIAAFLTYKLFGRSLEPTDAGTHRDTSEIGAPPARGGFTSLLEGGQEAVQIVLRSLPILIITILIVDLLTAVGILEALSEWIAPVFRWFDLPAAGMVPVATKYVAGGTAMTGIALDLADQGILSAVDVNRLGGALINPLDPVGVAVLCSADPRVARCLRPALQGAAIGVLFRTGVHLLLL